MSLQKYVKIFTERYDSCKCMGYKFETVPVEQGLLKQSEEYNGTFSVAYGKLAQNLVTWAKEI